MDNSADAKENARAAMLARSVPKKRVSLAKYQDNADTKAI